MVGDCGLVGDGGWVFGGLISIEIVIKILDFASGGLRFRFLKFRFDMVLAAFGTKPREVVVGGGWGLAITEKQHRNPLL